MTDRPAIEAEAAQEAALPSLQPWVRHHDHCDAITDMDESSCDCGLNATLARLSRLSDGRDAESEAAPRAEVLDVLAKVKAICDKWSHVDDWNVRTIYVPTLMEKLAEEIQS